MTTGWRGSFLALGASLLAAACGAGAGSGASAAEGQGEGAAASANAGAGASAAPAVQRSTDAQALLDGDYDRTLKLANQAIRAHPRDPWPYYNRACALIGLGRTKEAIVSFKEAQARFGGDEYGRVVSAYGRARAFAAAHRCDEASRAYRAFAEMVGTVNEASAEMALAYAKDCVSMAASPPEHEPAAAPPGPAPAAATSGPPP